MTTRNFIKSLFLIGIVSFMASCQNADCSTGKDEGQYVTIHFDANTEHETNKIQDQEVRIGKKITKKPRVFFMDDNPDNLDVSGWYTSKDLTVEWDFKKDLVEHSMTLYAKWEKSCVVNYYLGDDPTPVKSQQSFAGTYIKEYPSYAAGYRYLGSFADEEHTIPFDFSSPIKDDTNVYMGRSEGIYVADSPSFEGEILPTHLYENVTTKLGSYVEDSEEGWVEKRTLANGEVCTYANMGYTPTIGDPYLEFDLNLDITHSQVLRFTFKNLGNCNYINLYFTAYVDFDNGVYSKTSGNYNDTYMIRKALSVEQRNMDENDPWTYLDFDLSSIYTDGYSVWGTSPTLGSLRFQTTYRNTSRDDMNEFLFCSIEGIYKKVDVVDTTEIINKLQNDSQESLDEAKSAQISPEFGLIFPKDSDSVISSSIKGFDYYEKTDGLLLHTDNEISLRKEELPTASIEFNVEKEIDLSEKPTFAITLQNLGYGKELSLYLHNDENDLLVTTISMDSRMVESKKFILNLFGRSEMYGKLTKIELRYDPVGVDNAILLNSITLEDYKPYDIQGINFNDKSFFGLTSNEQVELSFNQNSMGTKFDVATDGAEVSTTVERLMTLGGYEAIELQFVQPRNSSLTKIEVFFTVGENEFRHEFVFDQEAKGSKTQRISSSLLSGEQGILKGLRIKFYGTGSLTIKAIEFDPGEDAIRYDQSYENVFNMMDWSAYLDYSYDKINACSIFTKHADQQWMSASMYIGYTTTYQKNYMTPHTCFNIKLENKTTINFVYQNRTDVGSINFNFRFGTTLGESGDTSTIPELNFNGTAIRKNMNEYEWDTVTLIIPDEFKQFYLAKVRFEFSGPELRLRSVSVL